jgi:hypothetical protein
MPGSRLARLDSARLDLDVAPEADGGFIFVPIRSVLEALGAVVSWTALDHVVTLSVVPRRTPSLALRDATQPWLRPDAP